MSWYRRLLLNLFTIALTIGIIFLVLLLMNAEKGTFNPTDLNIKKININYEDDSDKRGEMHSRLFDASFYQDSKTRGNSSDVVHMIFDHPAEVLGFWVSIDHPDLTINLVEMAATVNTPQGYHTGVKEDAILHTSYVMSSSRFTDEKVMFQPGFGIQLHKGDYVSLGAFITNMHPFSRKRVSGEFVIYYRWLKKENLE